MDDDARPSSPAGSSGRVLALAAFAAHVPSGVALALYPFLVTPPATLPAAYAIPWLAATRAGRPLIAHLGAGRTATAALALAMAGAVAPLVSHDPAPLAAGLVLAGAGGGMLASAVAAFAAATSTRAAHDVLLGRAIAAGGLGLLAGLPIGAGLAPQSLHLPPLLAAAAAAVALAVALATLPAHASDPTAGEPGVVADLPRGDDGKDR